MYKHLATESWILVLKYVFLNPMVWTNGVTTGNARMAFVP